MNKIDWAKNHFFKISNETECLDDISEDDIKKYRDKIEPWLAAIFQSEHLALLAGTGLTSAVTSLAKVDAPGMDTIKFMEFSEQIRKSANSQAKEMGRGKANIEDDLRVAIELYKGLLIQGDDAKAKTLKDDINAKLIAFITKVLTAEKEFLEKEGNALTYLKSFVTTQVSPYYKQTVGANPTSSLCNKSALVIEENASIFSHYAPVSPTSFFGFISSNGSSRFL